MKRTSLVRAAWAFAVFLLLVVLVKTFVGDVYHVDSASMEPTIWGTEDGGEWVFVRYDRSPPKRHELIVVLRAGETTPIVKRVEGLPGESVRIANGDVLVNNQRLPPGDPRPPLVCVFDDRYHAVTEHFNVGQSEAAPWKHVEDHWELHASAIKLNAGAGLMFFKDGLNDDYSAPDHSIQRGTAQANDAALECDVRATTATGQIRIGLTEQGDTFQAVIEPLAHDLARLSITRRFKSDSIDTLETREVPYALGSWTHVLFSNVDNALTLRFGDVTLRTTYKDNTLHPIDYVEEGKSIGERAYLGGEAGRFDFRGIRVLRDLVYTARGERGTKTNEELGPSQIFLLGDHSSQSRDSREWGPVRTSEIVGRAAWVVWPLGRVRPLVAVEVAPDPKR